MSVCLSVWLWVDIPKVRYSEGYGSLTLTWNTKPSEYRAVTICLSVSSSLSSGMSVCLVMGGYSEGSIFRRFDIPKATVP